MAGLMSNVERRNSALQEALGASRSTRAKTGVKKTKVNPSLAKKREVATRAPARRPVGLRAAPKVNAPKTITSGMDARQRRLKEIEAKIKALGG